MDRVQQEVLSLLVLCEQKVSESSCGTSGGRVLTFGQLVEVHEEAQHEGAGDEAEGRADGSHSQEDS